MKPTSATERLAVAAAVAGLLLLLASLLTTRGSGIRSALLIAAVALCLPELTLRLVRRRRS
jgi:hypothetical protein